MIIKKGMFLLYHKLDPNVVMWLLDSQSQGNNKTVGDGGGDEFWTAWIKNDISTVNNNLLLL